MFRAGAGYLGDQSSSVRVLGIVRFSLVTCWCRLPGGGVFFRGGDVTVVIVIHSFLGAYW